MRSRSGVASLAVAIIFCVFLAACGGSSSNSGGGAAVEPGGHDFIAARRNGGHCLQRDTLGYQWNPALFLEHRLGQFACRSELEQRRHHQRYAHSAGTSSFTVQVTDSNSRTGSAALSITIQAGAALTITTASLPGGTVGTAYSATLAASGGAPPYTWSISCR